MSHLEDIAKQSSSTSTTIFGPLFFEESHFNQCCKPVETKCVLCEDSFNLAVSLPVFAAHLFEVHNIIIEDIQKIDNLPEYIHYWRYKFKYVPLDQVIPSVSVGTAKNKFFVFSILLKEDRELRHKLRLEHALKVQEFERNDKSYVRGCLFCSLQYEGTRQGYLEHLLEQHNLVLGNPQNLVYIEKLVDKIDKKLEDLKCIYCEKVFPDRKILKEHMRKKLHKTVNPENKEYDEFYIVNYLEENKNWQAIQQEDDRYAVPNGDNNSDEEYSDWCETDARITCLFCNKTDTNINTLCLHMDGDHGFDFVMETKDLDFYQKIKLVNYIRKQIHDKKCPVCEEGFENIYRLEHHLVQEEHYKLPDLKRFNQPEYYFPTYENDTFLYCIDDVED